jgi:putative Holliday junction resolvase
MEGVCTNMFSWSSLLIEFEFALVQKADEFVVGLPKSWDGKDNKQAGKCRSFAGRLASLAARR